MIPITPWVMVWCCMGLAIPNLYPYPCVPVTGLSQCYLYMCHALVMVPATNHTADHDVAMPATTAQVCAAAVIAKLDKNTSKLDILEGTIRELTDNRRSLQCNVALLGTTVTRLEAQLLTLESPNDTLTEKLSEIQWHLDDNGGSLGSSNELDRLEVEHEKLEASWMAYKDVGFKVCMCRKVMRSDSPTHEIPGAGTKSVSIPTQHCKPVHKEYSMVPSV